MNVQASLFRRARWWLLVLFLLPFVLITANQNWLVPISDKWREWQQG